MLSLYRLVLAVIVASCLGGPSRSQQTAPSASQPTADGSSQWFADSASGCKFFVEQLKPAGREGGVWRGESKTTASWSGACIDGLASGLGTAILSAKPVARDGSGYDPGVLEHWPPFENIFYGTFSKGKPTGLLIVEYSNGMSAVEDFVDGEIVGTPVVHVGVDLEAWATLSKEDIRRAVERDFRKGPLQPATIAPKFGESPLWSELPPNDLRRFQELFAFDKYRDETVMGDALEKTIPRFSRAPALLLFLISASGLNGMNGIYFAREPVASCHHGMGLAVYEQTAWYCVVSRRLDVGHGNADRWLYAVVMADDATILYSEIHRFFEGDNFLARGAPLRAENFLWSKDFMAAALQLLGPSPSLGKVSTLMERAGMKQGRRAMRLGGDGQAVSPGAADLAPEETGVEFYHDEGAFSFFVSGCGKITDLVWTFEKATGKFLSVTPEDGTGCL